MKRLTVFFITSLVILALALSISGCGTAQQPGTAEPIKVGFMFDLTGFLAPTGKDNHQGALIALDQAGKQLMGRPLQAIIEDSGSDVNVAMDKARKLAEVDKVRVIVGPIFGAAQVAMGGYADKIPIPVLTIAASQNVEVLKNSWSFLVHGTCEGQGYPMGIYAAEKLGFKTATTLASDFVAGKEFIEGFKKGFELKGGKVIQQQWSPPGTTNFVPFFVAAKPADCLVTWWPGAEALSGFKQYKELNIKMPLLQPADGGMSANPAVIKQLGEGVVGIYTTVTYSYLANTHGNKDFVQQYSKRFGAPPSSNAGGAYVSTQIALEAIKKAGNDNTPQGFKKAILALKMDSVQGPRSFSKDRIGSLNCYVVKIDKNYEPIIVGEYRTTVEKIGDQLHLK